MPTGRCLGLATQGVGWLRGREPEGKESEALPCGTCTPGRAGQAGVLDPRLLPNWNPTRARGPRGSRGREGCCVKIHCLRTSPGSALQPMTLPPSPSAPCDHPLGQREASSGGRLLAR